MSDFVVGEKLGEGSFGIVYSGAIVPKNMSVEDRLGKRGRRLEMDERFKDKVILKKASSFYDTMLYFIWSREVNLLSSMLLLTPFSHFMWNQIFYPDYLRNKLNFFPFIF